MAWTQTDLEMISAALSTGAKRVRFQTHETEFHSIDEMLKLRDIIRNELEGQLDSGGPIFTEYQSGY